MLQKAADNNLIQGLCNELVPQGVISLQYADDTILFLDRSVENANNFKWIMTCFELMSGMRVNYHKSELIPIYMHEEECITYANIFGCPVGNFPIRYLGIPLHH
uniref:Reverse transcriptase domain-containing protein n=1 Tax=Arundo donax TaxID=35708 RepID=A0A0A8Y5Y3_ARUDO